MVLVEPPYPGASSEETTGLAGSGIAPDVRFDGLAQTFQKNPDGHTVSVTRLAGGSDAVGGEKVVVSVDVEVVLAEIPRRVKIRLLMR